MTKTKNITYDEDDSIDVPSLIGMVSSMKSTCKVILKSLKSKTIKKTENTISRKPKVIVEEIIDEVPAEEPTIFTK